MSDLALWRWIFGLALVPAAGLMWLSRSLPNGGLADLALGFAIAYLGSLLFTALLAGVALAAYTHALEAWDFMLRLLGIRPS